jgi:hypothetical protein
MFGIYYRIKQTVMVLVLKAIFKKALFSASPTEP